MPVNAIPEKIVNYNAYNEGEKLIGVAGEVTLPNLEAMTETISGAGIAGEFESATPGHFGPMQTEIPFRTITDQSFNLMEPKAKTLTFRASQQSFDVAGGEILHRGLKVTMKVMPKGLDLGKLAVGKPSDSKNSLEVLYIKVEVNDGGSMTTLLEYDKLNFIFIVNGVDYFAQIRDQI